MLFTHLHSNTLCSVKTRTRFSSIAWGPGASRSSGTSLTHGLIVGGMADGVVTVWDAGSLLQGMLYIYIYLRNILAPAKTT